MINKGVCVCVWCIQLQDSGLRPGPLSRAARGRPGECWGKVDMMDSWGVGPAEGVLVSWGLARCTARGLSQLPGTVAMGNQAGQLAAGTWCGDGSPDLSQDGARLGV